MILRIMLLCVLGIGGCSNVPNVKVDWCESFTLVYERKAGDLEGRGTQTCQFRTRVDPK